MSRGARHALQPRRDRSCRRPWIAQRGAALPLAVLSLTIVLSLTTALAAVGTSEPTIALNHERSARARAAAEAGLHVALATLGAREASAWPASLAAAPFVPLPGAAAGYRIAVEVNPAWALAARANERLVTVTGYAPGDTAPQRGVASLQAVVERDSIMATLRPPAALTLAAGGSITGEIDARDGAGGWCPAGPPQAGIVTGGRLSTWGSVWGPGNAIPNEIGPDIAEASAGGERGPAVPAFDANELAALRALAAERGTLYAGHPEPVRFGGDAAPLPGGLVVVEGDVDIAIDDVAWTGWLVVLPAGTRTGSVTVACRPPCAAERRTLTLNGLVYAADGFTVDTASADRALAIRGAVVARQTSGTRVSITPRSAADFRLTYDCSAVRGAVTGTATTTGTGLARHGWRLKSGTYKEVSRQ